jgi:hypothetical protein
MEKEDVRIAPSTFLMIFIAIQLKFLTPIICSTNIIYDPVNWMVSETTCEVGAT